MKPSHKSYLIIAGFILVLIVAHRLAFSKTIETKASLKTLEAEMMDLEQVARLNASLSAKEVQLDSVLQAHNLKNKSIQQGLLDFLNSRADSLDFKIETFDPPFVVSEDGIEKSYYAFTLRGGYKGLEQLVFELEQQQAFGLISSLSLEKQDVNRLRRALLELKVILND